MYFGVVWISNYNRNQGTNHHPGNHQRSSRQGAKVLFSTGNCKCANCVVYSQQYQYIYSHESCWGARGSYNSYCRIHALFDKIDRHTKRDKRDNKNDGKKEREKPQAKENEFRSCLWMRWCEMNKISKQTNKQQQQEQQEHNNNNNNNNNNKKNVRGRL